MEYFVLPGVMFSAQESLASTLLTSMIHPSIRARLPKVPSLRRGLSRSLKRETCSIPTSTSAADDDIDSATLTPDSEASRRSYDGSFFTARPQDSGDIDSTLSGSLESLNSSMKLSPWSPARSEQGKCTECGTGISWKYANQGACLLDRTAREISAMDAVTSPGEAAFSRQLYIHAVGYLVKGLPSDLRPDEQISIKSALPPCIILPPSSDTEAVLGDGGEQSVLHQCLAATIVQFFIIFRHILPLAQNLLQSAYKYERSHHLSERLLSGVLDGLDYSVKRGSDLRFHVVKASDGRLGQFISGLLGWVFIGIVGGVCEGFGRGMVILNANKPTHR